MIHVDVDDNAITVFYCGYLVLCVLCPLKFVVCCFLFGSRSVSIGHIICPVSNNMCYVRGHMFKLWAYRAFNMLAYCCYTFNLYSVAISVENLSYLTLVSSYNFTRTKRWYGSTCMHVPSTRENIYSNVSKHESFLA